MQGPWPAFVRSQFDRKPVRYSMVSVIAVAFSQTVLLLCLLVLDMTPVSANLAAVGLGSVPSYLLNRKWVWGKRGSHAFFREVLPFWVMAFLGLAFSTFLVHLAAQWSEAALVASGANLAAFGSLWVVKYLILDAVLFKHRGTDAPVLV